MQLINKKTLLGMIPLSEKAKPRKIEIEHKGEPRSITAATE